MEISVVFLLLTTSAALVFLPTKRWVENKNVAASLQALSTRVRMAELLAYHLNTYVYVEITEDRKGGLYCSLHAEGDEGALLRRYQEPYLLRGISSLENERKRSTAASRIVCRAKGGVTFPSPAWLVTKRNRFSLRYFTSLRERRDKAER